MKLSTRTRYGIRAVIELAQHQGDRPLQLKTIAERQNISIKYLEQLMGVLRSAGFIRSVRGAKGGYVLARPPLKSHSTRFSGAWKALLQRRNVWKTPVAVNGRPIVRLAKSGCSSKKPSDTS